MGSALSIQDGLAVLAEASARNVPVELHYDNPDRSFNRIEPDILYAQTRLLGADEHRLYLDRPQHIGRQVYIARGRTVDAYFCLHDRIYTFRSVVTNLNCLVELNRGKTVVGMCLSTPNAVTEGQRREHHRVRLGALDPIHATIHEASRDDPNSCAITARRCRGRLFDASLGGLGIRIGGDDRYQFQVGRYYYLSLVLPEQDEELIFLTEVCHVEEILRGEFVLIGFHFQRWPDPIQMRQKLEGLRQFLNEVERRRLRKNRGR